MFVILCRILTSTGKKGPPLDPASTPDVAGTVVMGSTIKTDALQTYRTLKTMKAPRRDLFSAFDDDSDEEINDS